MEAAGVAHECQILSVPIENPVDSDVNSPFKHLGMPNSPCDDDQGQDPGSVSDCESGISGPNRKESLNFSDELIELYEGDRSYEIVKRRFLSGLGTNGMRASIFSIRRNCFSSFIGQARVQSFRIFARAMEKKRGGNSNLKYAWYGGSRDEIRKIISHGFGYVGGDSTGVYGHGVYLAPDNSSIESVKSSIEDEDGLKHVLLCRVILGNMEQVVVGSQQSHPSSDEFDFGIDNLISPNKYIVWSSHMNTHILPEYVISFRADHPCSEGMQRIQPQVRSPNSPWVPFTALISALSLFLPPDEVGLVSKYYNHYKERKVSRHELIRRLRNIVGDKLLTSVIKSSYRNKQVKKSKGSSSTSIGVI